MKEIPTLLPSCGQAEQPDTSQPAATEPVQVAQAQPGSRTSGASAGGSKPNIVVIMGDDIGMWNIGAYHRGITGYADALSRPLGHLCAPKTRGSDPLMFDM